jgi:phosphoribosyl 1,2-cyclic phosphodiesterase
VLEVTSLGSGSCGNALLLRSAATSLLIDCGVGVRRLAPALRQHGLSLSDLDALLLSHEHSDHVRELDRFAPAGTPVYATRGTAAAVGLPAARWTATAPLRPLAIGELEIVALPVRHDAAEPCGFLVRTPAGAVTVITDLGAPSPEAAEAIRESRLVVLEANHDETMVRNGPYPVYLQRRILSDSGHLSNRACGEMLAAALRGSAMLPAIWLAHLSASNNRPSLAKQTVERRLALAGLRLAVTPLPRRESGPTWTPAAPHRAVSQLTLDLFA